MASTTPGKRVDAIDFWRGFALLTIFVDHVPENAFQHITFKNFGLSDAAELFVFLSGVSVALAYGTRFFNGETWEAVRAVFRRALTLYWVQLLTSLLIIGLLAAAAGWWDNDDLLEDPDRDLLVASPVQGIPAMLVMAHQLGNVNILPMYVALLLLTPALLLLARRSDWRRTVFADRSASHPRHPSPRWRWHLGCADPPAKRFSSARLRRQS